MKIPWQIRINDAQKLLTYTIGGKEYDRIKYGDEPGMEEYKDGRPCHDCAVIEGQYHVPGCDWERCPKSGGQVISCYCQDD